MRTNIITLMAVSLLGVAGGCGSARAQSDPGAATVTPEDVASLRRLVLEVEQLRAENAALKQRLAHVEQRVGLAAFDSQLLKPAYDTAVSPKEGVLVDGPGGRGKRRKMAQHLEGFDGYVLAYWATWCVPCTSPEELAHLRRLQAQLRKSNVELVSVLVDDLDKAMRDSRAPTWLYPFWFREDAHIDMLPKELIQRIGLNLPLFLVVSRAGQVRYIYNNKLSDDAVRDIVTATANVCRI